MVGLFCGPVPDASAAQVTLAWDTSSGASGYRLFMRQEGQAYSYSSPAWQGPAAQCTIAYLNDNTTYYFVARAFDASGQESGNSNEVRFHLDTNKPYIPEITSPADNASNVSLTPELITGPFQDPDAGDYHAATQWQLYRSADDLICFNVLSDFFLTDLRLPPLILDETSSYTWRVRHRNQHGAASDPVSGSFTTAVWAEDGDANGIPDNQEVLEYLDLDNNGQRDQTQTRMKCLRSIRGDVSVAIDGAKSPSVVALSAVQAVDNLSLDSPFSGTLTLPIGLLAFKVITAGAGNSVEITIHFSQAVPADQNWVAYSMTQGYENYAPNSSLSADRKSIAIRLQDGGSGDLDGVANGIIVGMGAHGSIRSISSNLDGSGSGGGGGGGGGCFINSLRLF
jgi:chitinase